LSAFLRALVPALAACGHPSEIASLDRPDAPWVNSGSAPVHPLGPAKLGYAYAPRLRSWLRAQAPRFDCVLVHGLWQYPGLATHLALSPARVPYYIFPHGMLDPWFKRQYPLKHIKKWIYWHLAERRILAGAQAVLFTCEEERWLARESFGGRPYRERVVNLGTATPPARSLGQREAFFQRHPELRDHPFWLFLGRIHPKKGPDLLLRAYAQMSRHNPALPRLVMAGPCADNRYLRELQSFAAESCPQGSVLWSGMLSGDAKWGALRAAEVFVLPSHQENFGIAVVEALACGVPVLISNQVNIWREIVDDGAGLVGADTVDGTLRLLERWCSFSTETRQRMRAAAVDSFAGRFEIGAVAQSLLEVVGESQRVHVFP